MYSKKKNLLIFFINLWVLKQPLNLYIQRGHLCQTFCLLNEMQVLENCVFSQLLTALLFLRTSRF